MADFKIEKGIPLPKALPSRLDVYPFDQMTPGDSFLVPSTPDDVKKVRARIGQAIGRRKKQHPKQRFETRTVDGGVRVWRTA